MSSNGWKTYKLGEVVELSQGLAINAKTKYLLQEGGLPLLRITDLFNNTQEQFINPDAVAKQCIANRDEIIYTRTGQVGYVFKGKVGVVHNNCFKVTPRKEILDKDFLFWFLHQKTVREHANAVASGSVQKDLPHGAFKSIEIEIPDLVTQEKVASILSSLDDKIELNRQTNTTLEAIAQALFKEWFVDFNYPGATGEMVESELGMIPEGWKIGCIGEVCENVRKSVQPKDLESDVAYLGLEHIQRKSLSVPDWGKSSDVDSQKSAFSKGDVLFGRLRPYFHKVGIAPVDGICSTDILVVRPKKAYSHAFVVNHLFDEKLIAFVSAIADGTRMPRVDWKSIANYQIVIPSESILREFNHFAGVLYKKMLSSTTENHVSAPINRTV